MQGLNHKNIAMQIPVVKLKKDETLVGFVKTIFNDLLVITAVFPYDDEGNGLIGCYAHVGQHGTCCMEWVNEQEMATPEEYADLKQELESIGYKFVVIPHN
jgi:hypothetical protein